MNKGKIIGVQHSLTRAPAHEGNAFANTLSELLVNGWELVNSGIDAGTWWAIHRKVDYDA